MGEVADSMINGEVCACCGVYLEPKERAFLQHYDKKTVHPQVTMPKNGSGFGVAVDCFDCYKEKK